MLMLLTLGRGDFQKNFTIFLAFVPNAPMTIRFILVPLKMFVSIRKTLHTDPILREQPNLNHNKDKINFHFVLFFYFIIEICWMTISYALIYFAKSFDVLVGMH